MIEVQLARAITELVEIHKRMDELKRACDGYRGEVTVGLMVDAALIPDPNQIVTQLERELTALSTSVGSTSVQSAAPAGPRPAAPPRRHCRHETRAAARLCLLPRG